MFLLITKRFIMTILFVSALFATFESISGVEAKKLLSVLQQKQHSYLQRSQSYHENSYKENALSYKTLLHEAAIQTATASSMKMNVIDKPLEEAFDWSRYPVHQVLATGYTAGYESTGKKPGHPEYGITYSGVKVKRDLYSTIAADLNVFPIGTILFIPGYGYGVVADKGGAIKGDRLDLYYETVEDVYELWGKKELEVYVIKKGSGTLTEEELTMLNEDETMQVFRQQVR